MPDTPSPSSPAPADGGLTAALEEIRGLLARRDQIQARVVAASDDGGELRELDEAFTGAQDRLAARVPSLVAAIEAVLKLHQPRPIYGFATEDARKSVCGHSAEYEGDAHFEGDDGYWYCIDRITGHCCSSCADEDDADLWEEWPCPTYRAITRELTGKGGGDGGE